MSQTETAQITWRDERIPVSSRFDDPYFSLSGGLEETRHVFLRGNNLSARFRDGFQIAELGFGTGLNFLATWQAWRASDQPGTLHFTSFEAYPMAAEDMEKALAAFPELADFTGVFLDQWRKGTSQMKFPGVSLAVIPGDANLTLPKWPGQADAWYLDGFSPAKNPELWGKSLLAEVAIHTEKGGTFATYSAAGQIRRALTDVGFRTERIAGFGRKRHMTIGQLEPRE
jgi:tRNA U34 5-methylaminomethyl-2-thiouridine-forming methyltransferase MnmC